MNLILQACQHHQYVVVDYEGADLLLSPAFLEKILNRHNGYQGKLILTLAARANEFAGNFARLREYTQLASAYDQLGFCIVAGHPAYPSVDPSISSYTIMEWMAKILRSQTPSTTQMFVGTENLSLQFIASLV
ncbi:MAG: hypothetical protein ACFFCQ_18395, partial [Promethearchaeota archaeon]